MWTNRSCRDCVLATRPPCSPMQAARASREQSATSRSARSSRRATCRRRTIDRSWSTASRWRSTTVPALSRAACRSKRRSSLSADAVIVDGVSKRYGDIEAVRDLSLTIGAGEMFGLIGADGAGKTTTIRLLCGLLRADAGRIRVLGLDPVGQHGEL